MKAAVQVAMAAVVLCGSAAAQAAGDEDMTVIDRYIAGQARRERGEEYKEARKVATGDLNHDGAPETAVLYTIEGQRGSNQHIQYLAVFVRRNGRLEPWARAEAAGKGVGGVEAIAIHENVLELDVLNYAPEDASCCPSVKGKASFRLAGKSLREQKPGERNQAR